MTKSTIKTNEKMTLEESIIYLSEYLTSSDQETNDCVERYEQAETDEDEAEGEPLTLADELRELYNMNIDMFLDDDKYLTRQDWAEFNVDGLERISKILCIDLESQYFPNEAQGLTENERAGKTKAKEVAQYDMQGNLLNVFCSAMEAKRQTGSDNSHIGKCCKGKLKTTNGYIWEYTN